MRRIHLVGMTLLALLLGSGCEPPAARDPGVEAPPGNGGGNVPVTPTGPVGDNDDDDDEEPPPAPPAPPPTPPTPAPPDPSACPLPNGQVVDCAEELGTPEAYCANVYPGAVGDAPPAPDFQLVAACGTCSAVYWQPPAGTDCLQGDPGAEPAPGEEPPPGEPVDVTPPAPQAETTCKGCHAPSGYDGLNSIENPHAWGVAGNQLSCTDCHGGDGTATNPVFAHVCPPPQVGTRLQQVFDQRAFFLSFTTAGVQLLPDYSCTQKDGTPKTTKATEWLAFINPGDLRANRDGYGCGTCHSDVVDKVSRSVMGNATGLNSGTRHGVGALNKYAERRGKTAELDWNTLADYGATAITNPDYDPNNRVVGEVGSLRAPEVFTGEDFKYNTSFTADAVNNSLNVNNVNADNYPNGMAGGSIAEQLFQEVLNQACTGCHLQNGYNNFRAGDYRSTGCSACHFQVGVSGRSESTDPNVKKYEPQNPDFLAPGEQMHIKDHRVRNVAKLPGQGGLSIVVQGVGDSNCIVCHEGSNRTVAQYHGYRLDQNQDLTNEVFYPSQNTVQFTTKSELFGENTFFNNRNVNQWISTEIWQADVANELGQAGQDETPDDVHHKSGMGCIDCHGTGATHGEGAIYSRMKVATHQNDVLCETCHGTIDEYAKNDGTYVLDQAGNPLKHIRSNGSATAGNFWLVSKLNGSLHYVPQVKDTVNASGGGIGGKTYPPGSPRQNQPVFSWVASYAMGRYQASQNLTDGYGPVQPTGNNQIQMHEGFSHSDGEDGVNPATRNRGMECYTCHAAWQNNCIGCHLDAFYENDPNQYRFSQITGERIYFHFNANFRYQNPVNFMMGINDRGKISPYQGLHRFFSYQDLNGDTSNRVSYGDRNGLGNDPQLKNPQRNNLPALQNQPFTPHSIRGRYTTTEIGMRGCLDCHAGSANEIRMWDQAGPATNNNNGWDLTDVYANNYAASAAKRVPESRGLGTDLWQFDADGESVFFTNNDAVYDLDRLVEANGVSNTSANHPLLDPYGQKSNADYRDNNDTNQAAMARPFTNALLTKLQLIDNVGLTDVYYYNAQGNEDPNDTKVYVYFLNDYNYVGQ